jgi:iron complex transport system substrate-binding protein
MIQCRRLSFQYSSRQVLRDIELQAGPGECVAVIGPNGAGKSTLLRCIAGVLAPAGGSIELDGRDLDALSPKERARRISLVPQRGEFLPAMRAAQSVLLGRYPHLSWFGSYSRADYEAVREAMASAGCLDLAERPLGALSGGELQRVFLARALAQGGSLLLLDELSAGLDMARVSELFDLLEERRRAGCCCISAMHDLNLAALYATRLVGLKAGRILFDGPVEAVLTEEAMHDLFGVRLHLVRHPASGRPQFCPQSPARLRLSQEADKSAAASGVSSWSGLACLLLCLFFLMSAPAALAAVSCRDSTGREIRLQEPATRIVPLYGAFGELLAAMGQGGRLAARTEADAAVPALAHLPSVGTHMRPNPELVAGLRPDLALMLRGRREAGQQGEYLQQLGIPVASFSMDSFEDLFAALRCLGQLTDARSEAAQLESALRARLAAVARQVEGKERPCVFFEARYPNLLGAGRASIVSDIIAHAGGRNVVELDVRLARLNEEELLRLNPDVYLVQRGPMNTADLPPGQRPHFAPLKAVREDRVLVVDERLFSRPGPASVDAVEQLASYLHQGCGKP